MIELVGLEAKAKARVKHLSGGQQRRLDLGLALVGNPELIFLDEPTTGFDPSARREAWDVVRGLCAEGRTVVLTTHYMDEAQELADTVTVIAAGRVVASGSPDTLGGRDHGRDHRPLRPARRGSPSATCPCPPVWPPRCGASFVEFSIAEPTEVLHVLTQWAMRPGRGAGGPGRQSAVARGRLPRAHRGADHGRTRPPPRTGPPPDHRGAAPGRA